jgi:endonuclease G
MTNMIPQAPNNNQGPWAALEIYCRELVKQGNELYIYCGGEGSKGFIDSGRVQIPEKTWKAVLVLGMPARMIFSRVTSICADDRRRDAER